MDYKRLIYISVWFIILFLMFLWWLWLDFYLTKKYIDENWVDWITDNTLWFIKVIPDYDLVEKDKLNVNINEILFYQKYYNKFKDLNCANIVWKLKLQRNYIIDLSTFEKDKIRKEMFNQK